MLDVTAFGARDGEDSTAAFRTAIEHADQTLWVPAGTYILRDLPMKSISMLGEVGGRSVLKRHPDASFMATADSAVYMYFNDLAFDFNGQARYGGIEFTSCQFVKYNRCQFYDSAPPPLGEEDRYALVCRRGISPSRMIEIRNCVVRDLQLEFDHCSGVIVDNCTSVRGVRTGAIGCFTISDETICENIAFTNNVVIDPIGAAFAIHLDPPWNNNCEFDKINITNNVILRTMVTPRENQAGISIGTPSVNTATHGNIFKNLTLTGNKFIYRKESNPGRSIQCMGGSVANYYFENLKISGNDITNDTQTPTEGYQIEVRRALAAVIENNTVRRGPNGIALVESFMSTMRNNNINAIRDIASFDPGSTNAR